MKNVIDLRERRARALALRAAGTAPRPSQPHRQINRRAIAARRRGLYLVREEP